jgi:hypothetical protein
MLKALDNHEGGNKRKKKAYQPERNKAVAFVLCKLRRHERQPRVYQNNNNYA